MLSLRSLRKSTPTPDPVAVAARLVIDLAPDPWDVDVLVQRVADHRGHPICIQAQTIASLDFNGYSQPGEDRDLIVHRDTATPRQRDAIICHELGHLLLGHQGGVPKDMVRAAVPDSFPQALLDRFYRSVYDAPEEAEAETFATLVASARLAASRRHADRMTTRLR